MPFLLSLVQHNAALFWSIAMNCIFVMFINFTGIWCRLDNEPLPLQSPVLLAYESRCRFSGPVYLSYRLNPCTESAGRGKGAGVVSKVVNVVKLFFTPAFSGHFAPQKRAAAITVHCGVALLKMPLTAWGSNKTSNVSQCFTNLWSITPRSLHDTASAKCNVKSGISVAFIVWRFHRRR